MSLQHFITEHLKITSKTKSATIRPTTKDELKAIIEQELERQGPNADLNFIDVSEVTNMSRLFFGFTDIQNIKINGWDTSNVTNMAYMFYGCNNFNSDLSGWDVSNVENMSQMFIGCNLFEGTGLDDWDVSNVTTMSHMFLTV